MKRVLLLTTYDYNSASSRIRHISLIPDLRDLGFDVSHHSFFDFHSLENRYANKTLDFISVFKSYLKRARIIVRARRYDLIWVEKEIFPYFPVWLESLICRSAKTPIIVDMDDDWFAKYEEQIPRSCQSLFGKYHPVTAGNVSYSTSNESIFAKIRSFKIQNSSFLLPPYIDLNLYPKVCVEHERKQLQEIKLGWIGSPLSSLHQLNPNMDLIKALASSFEVHLIGGHKSFEAIPNVFVHDWALHSEIEQMLKMDIAIMPLPNDYFTRGKSGYKAIQFMALGIPVVASNLANSSKVLGNGRGFVVETIEDWIRVVKQLASNHNLRNQMGLTGSNWVKEEYSRANFLACLLDIFEKKSN